jgi:hypothetical protein
LLSYSKDENLIHFKIMTNSNSNYYQINYTNKEICVKQDAINVSPKSFGTSI